MQRAWSTAPWRRLPPAAVDGVVAAVVAGVMSLVIDTASDPGVERAPDPVAYLLGLAIGAVLVVRRRRPLAVLAATAALLFTYYALGYPGFEPALPLAVALYTAAAAGHPWWAAAVAAFFGGAEVIVRGIRQAEPVLHLLTALVQEAALLAVLILLGEVVRNRAARLAETGARLAESEARRERDAARLVAEERLRIAREIHDILGHALSAITVQAGLAADILDSDPAQARGAVRTLLGTSRSTMTELKATVGLLRDPTGQRSPAPSLADIDTLVEGVRSAGLRVDVQVQGARRALPAVVDLCAYRIAQESLTNVVRHAAAGSATLVVRYTPTELVVEVRDDGAGSHERAEPGHGLTGMAERAAALGGTLRAGPCPAGGFVVAARLPIEANQ